MPTPTPPSAPSSPPKENQWLNLLCNVVLPTLIFMKLSPEDKLGPTWALALGCALPIGYGVYDYVTRKVFNLLSVLGLVAVLLKGVFGLLKTSAFWIACSEAALPLLFGIGILLTIRGQEPLVQRFLLSPQLFDIDRIRRQLALRGNAHRLRPLMVTTSVAYAGTMFLSAVLNFILASALLRAEPGSEEFVAQLGKFTGLQFPVIALPLMVLTVLLFLWVMKRLSTLTGVPAESLLAGDQAQGADRVIE
jgi:hypothetical protein